MAKRLCDSCRHALIVKGDSGEAKVYCGMMPAVIMRIASTGGSSDSFSGMPGNVTTNVVECSGYMNKNEQTLYEMQKTAWKIELAGKKFVGFIPPKKDDE